MVIMKYPHQALWPMVGVMQSKRPERVKACNVVTQRAVRVSLFSTFCISRMSEVRRLTRVERRTWLGGHDSRCFIILTNFTQAGGR